MDNVSTIGELVKIIADAGITIVCSAVLIIFCLKMFKTQQEQISILMKGHKAHPDNEDSEVLDIINNKIHEELRGVLERLKADRSFVYLYHNGGVSSSGLFFQRMSCICEVVSQGILPVSQQEQNLHKGAYSSLCVSLKQHNEWMIDDLETLRHHDDFLYQKMVSRHAKSSYLLALKNAEGHSIGFIGVDYCSYNEDVDVKEIRSVLKVGSTKVSSLVDIKSEVS